MAECLEYYVFQGAKSHIITERIERLIRRYCYHCDRRVDIVGAMSSLTVEGQQKHIAWRRFVSLYFSFKNLDGLNSMHIHCARPEEKFEFFFPLDIRIYVSRLTRGRNKTMA